MPPSGGGDAAGTSSEGMRSSGGCRYHSHGAQPDGARRLRERALALAPDLGLDPNAWYLRVLDGDAHCGRAGRPGSPVRAYWELQRVTGRTDLRDDWRGLADAFWEIDAA